MTATLTWDDPGDPTITRYEVNLGLGAGWIAIPVGDTPVTNLTIGLPYWVEYHINIRAVQGARTL